MHDDNSNFNVFGQSSGYGPRVSAMPESLQPNAVLKVQPRITDDPVFVAAQHIASIAIGVRANPQDPMLTHNLANLLTDAVNGAQTQLEGEHRGNPWKDARWRKILERPTFRILLAQVLRGFEIMGQLSQEWANTYRYISHCLEPEDGPQTEEDQYFHAHSQYAKFLTGKQTPPTPTDALDATLRPIPSPSKFPDYLPEDIDEGLDDEEDEPNEGNA